MAQNSLKLSGSVGHMAGNKQADVLLVQCCLKHIKGKTKFGPKPMYQGKLDGKCGKQTIAAICAFQSSEKIKDNGKINPGDATISKLKLRTPTTASKDIEPQTLASASGSANVTSSTAIKHNTIWNQAKVIKSITDQALLPPNEAKSLAFLIKKAAKDYSINFLLEGVEINLSNKLQVVLSIANIPSTSVAQQPDFKAVIKKLTASSRWAYSGKAYILVNRFGSGGLKSGSKPSPEFSKRLDIHNPHSLQPIKLAILHKAEKVFHSGRGADSFLKNAYGYLHKADPALHAKIRKLFSSVKKTHQLYLCAKQSGLFYSGRGENVQSSSFSGHVFIGGINDIGTKEAWGFYPDGVESITPELPIEIVEALGNNIEKLDGKIKSDIELFKNLLNGDPSIRAVVYQVTKFEYKRVISNMQSYATRNDYGLFTNSCVHAAFNSMRLINVDKNYNDNWSHSPSELYFDIPSLTKNVHQERKPEG